MRILLFLVPTLLFGISKDLPLDSYVTKNAWERIGLHDHYGIDITLLGLVSKNSSGNGEFLDLLPLIDFLATNGFDILHNSLLVSTKNQIGNLCSYVKSSH